MAQDVDEQVAVGPQAVQAGADQRRRENLGGLRPRGAYEITFASIGSRRRSPRSRPRLPSRGAPRCARAGRIRQCRGKFDASTVPLCGRQLCAGPRRTADLDRVATDRRRFGRQCRPGRHLQLQLYEVESRGALGDRVLHLQAGVHLQEEEVPASSARNRRCRHPRSRSRSPPGGPPRTTSRAWRECVRRAATAPPRPPSGDDAGSSIPARRQPTPCRAGRPSPGPRCVVPSRDSARRTPSGPERRLRLAAGRLELRGSADSTNHAHATSAATADALTSTGRSASVTAPGSSSASTGTPASAMIRLDSTFEPISRST